MKQVSHMYTYIPSHLDLSPTPLQKLFDKIENINKSVISSLRENLFYKIQIVCVHTHTHTSVFIDIFVFLHNAYQWAQKGEMILRKHMINKWQGQD